MIIKKDLVVSNKKRAVLVTELRALKFDIIMSKKEAGEAGETEETVNPDLEDMEDSDVGTGYNYLLGVGRLICFLICMTHQKLTLGSTDANMVFDEGKG